MNHPKKINGDETPPIDRLSSLTDREEEVLNEFCEVFETIEQDDPIYESISERLFITESTVKTHMGNIFVKLGLHKLHRTRRIGELVRTYCPLLTEEEGRESETEEEAKPEKEEKPEPVSEKVQRMVEELESATVPSRTGATRLPWFLLGIVVIALVIVSILAVRPTGGSPSARPSVPGSQDEEADYHEVTRVVLVSPTPAPPQPSSTPVVQTEKVEVTREVTVIAVATATPGPARPSPTPVVEKQKVTVVVTQTPAPTSTPRPIQVSLPFKDNFDEGPREEWEVIQGTWRMIDGTYGTDKGGWAYSIVGDPGWEDYVVEVDVLSRCIAGYATGIFVRRTSPGNGLLFRFHCCDMKWILQQNGKSTTIAHVDDGIRSHGCGNMTWGSTHVKLEAKGNTYSTYVNGKLVNRVQDDTMSRGRVGLGTTRSSDRVRFDNFVVTAIH